MPNDVNGKPLQVGDYVNVPCKVLSITQVGNYHRMDLELKYHVFEEDTTTGINHVNTRQVVKLE